MNGLMRLFGSAHGLQFLPHGHCYFWDPVLLYLQNGADLVIAVAYFAIPAGLLYYRRRRPTVPLSQLIFLFALFISACGLTHVMDIVTTWLPLYKLQGAVKVVTAALSALTAFVLIPLIPKALNLHSSEELEAANLQLQEEAYKRAIVQDELRAANRNLEANVRERVADLDAERDRSRSYLRALQAQKDELAASNAELEQFAYASSHDLKAPLRAIDNLSQWIGEDLGEDCPPQVKENIQLMRGRVLRMSTLLDGLLEYSRVGRQKHESGKLNLQQLVKEVLETLPPRKGFTVRIDADIPPFYAPAVPLKQVIMNLVNNAMKHHDRDDGTVSIEAQDRGQAVEITVRDDGPGIDPKYHDRIFQIFQTLRPRDEVEGSGIGLALVRKIVEAHGGWVRIESAPGEGCAFRVVWPKELDHG